MRDHTVTVVYENGSKKTMAVADMSDGDLIDCLDRRVSDLLSGHEDYPAFQERVRLEQFIRSLGLSSKRCT